MENLKLQTKNKTIPSNEKCCVGCIWDKLCVTIRYINWNSSKITFSNPSNYWIQ